MWNLRKSTEIEAELQEKRCSLLNGGAYCQSSLGWEHTVFWCGVVVEMYQVGKGAQVSAPPLIKEKMTSLLMPQWTCLPSAVFPYF